MKRSDFEKLKILKEKNKGKDFAKMSAKEKDELLETIAKILGLI